MKLTFRYDPAMEVVNFRAAFGSRNHRAQSSRQKLFWKRYRKLTQANAARFSAWFIAEQGVKPTTIVRDIRERWRRIEKRFFTRANRIWKTELPQKRLTVYLTSMDRCGYNFERGFFFVSTGPRGARRTCMHELWHWYFHFTVGKGIYERYGAAVHNDIKEALTTLLNAEFADLMPGLTDRGYPQHRGLRTFIRRSYARTHDVYRTIDRALAKRVGAQGNEKGLYSPHEQPDSPRKAYPQGLPILRR